MAREIHQLSRRAAGDMVTVDLGAISEPLFDFEPCGHAKGALTGARADRYVDSGQPMAVRYS